MISVAFSIIIIGLIMMFFISLFLYIFRKARNSSPENKDISEINRKLDRVIALLEEEKLNK